MHFLLLVPVVYVAAVFETSLAAVIRVGHVAPDLLALVAVLWLLRAPGPGTLLAAGAIGLLGDLIGAGRVGPGLACFLLVGYAVARLRARSAVDHFLGQVAVIWLATTLLAAAMAIGRWLLGELPVDALTLLARSAGVGIYTAGVSLPLLMVLGWIREPFRAPLAA